MDNSAQLAITASLNNDWEKAIEINQLILKQNQEDISALNRLAKAYLSLGLTKEAQKTVEQVLVIDKYNSIANKILEKAKTARPGVTTPTKLISIQHLIEVPGKSKLIQLTRVDRNIIPFLHEGEEVFLVTHNHSIAVHTVDKRNVGKLPEILRAKLSKYLKGDRCQYLACVKSISQGNVTIFLKLDCPGRIF